MKTNVQDHQIITRLTTVYSSIKYDDFIKLNNNFLHGKQIAFFKEFLKILKKEDTSQQPKSEIEINYNDSGFSIFFNIEKASFENKKKSFSLGSTIEEIIMRNKIKCILRDEDKISYLIQIAELMSQFYEEDNNIDSNNNKYYGNISGSTFFVDSSKNVHLLIDKQNSNDQNLKRNDIIAYGKLFTDFLKVKKANTELLTNRTISWFRNYHDFYDRIYRKFPNDQKDESCFFKEFKSIVNDIKQNDHIYKKCENIIEGRRDIKEKISFITPETFQTLIFAQLNGVCDINQICVPLFTQLCNMSEKIPEYYLFFNLILHIFFPSNNLNNRYIPYIDILNLFDSEKKISDIISNDLIKRYLPSDHQFKKILSEISIHDLDPKKFSLSAEIEKELSYSDSKSKTFLNILSNIFINIFDNPTPNFDQYEIFDYFGIIDLIANKNDLFHLTNPSLRTDYVDMLKKMRKRDELSNYFNKSCKNFASDPFISFKDNIEGTDYPDTSHKLLFRITDASFWYERQYKFTDTSDGQNCTMKDINTANFDIKKCVQYQNDFFNKSSSKYIIGLDKEKNHVVTDELSTTMLLPYYPTTLNNLIQKNDSESEKSFNDCDKILWSIQITLALKELEEYVNQNPEIGIDFRNLVYDQMFIIDTQKNMYLSSLAINIKNENNQSMSDGPMYFRSESNPTYFYKLGVLLFEIFTEIEPKNLFQNAPRELRLEKLKKGYSNYKNFNEYLDECCRHYDDNLLKKIIYRLIKTDNPFNNFDEVIKELKNLKVYKKYKYIIEMRESKAKKFDYKSTSSFDSLMLADIQGFVDISSILESFFNQLNENYNIKLEPISNMLNSPRVPDCQFEAINMILEAFQGDIDDLLFKTICQKYNENKTLIIKKSDVIRLGRSVNNCRIGDLRIYSHNDSFYPSSYRSYPQKVPMVSFEFFLKNCKQLILHHFEWIHQILYKIIQKGFYLSTNPKSYSIKLDDFALFYNIKTKKFDLDFILKSINQIKNTFNENAINLHSFGTLLYELINFKNKQFDIIFNHVELFSTETISSLINSFIIDKEVSFNVFNDGITSINEFIACSLKYNQKLENDDVKDYINDFLSYVDNRSYVSYVFQIYKKQLKSISKADIQSTIEKKIKSINEKELKKVIDSIRLPGVKSVNDLLIHINSQFSEMTNEIFEKIKNEVFNEVFNYSNFHDKNYKIKYSTIDEYMDYLEKYCPIKQISEEKIEGIYFYYTEDKCSSVNSSNYEKSILIELFPFKGEDELDILLKSKSLKQSILFILNSDQGISESHFSDYSYDQKVALLLKIFSEKNKAFISSLFDRNQQSIYQTIMFLLKHQITDDYKNLDEINDISNLELNFPQIEPKIIRKHYENNYHDYIKTIGSLCDLIYSKRTKYELKPNFDYSQTIVDKFAYTNINMWIPRHLDIGELDPKSYSYMIKRYICQLNPKFNFKLTLKVQNNKNRPELNIKLDDLISVVKKLRYKFQTVGGNIIIEIPRIIKE